MRLRVRLASCSSGSRSKSPMRATNARPCRARLLAYTVEPVAKRVLVRMLRDDDADAGALKAQLDVLAHAREVGEWDDAQDAAKQLVGWIVHEARPAPPPAEGERVDAEAVEQQA